MSGLYKFFDLAPVRLDMRDEVLQGLRRTQKVIAPKFFYDEHGSQLFDAITKLPEYYPSRVETALYEAHSAEIGQHFRGDVTLIEYGSGSSRKIRALLEGMRPAAYVPVDISSVHLESSAKTLQADYAWLDVYAVCADYSQDLQLPDEIPLAQPMAFFPGSSVGNFAPRGAQLFLERVRKVVGDTGKLLIGVDRRKDTKVIEAAYNDAQGVTAQFNLNLLTHLNRALGADFDLGAFAHESSYDVDKGRIQMFLVAQRAQRVNIAGETIDFAAGERIHTENSYKYNPQDFVELAAAAGFSEELHLTDSMEYFSVFLFAAKAP